MSKHVMHVVARTVVSLMAVLVMGNAVARANDVELLSTPCRLYDSRNIGGTGMGSKVTNTTVQTWDSAGSAQGGEFGCGVPENATGIILNITAYQPDSAGFGRLWAYGFNQPLSTAVNFASGQLNETTGTMIGLGSNGQLSLVSVYSPAHYIIDMTGFVAPCTVDHSTDIRYDSTMSTIWVPTTSSTTFNQIASIGRKIVLGGQSSQPGVYTITGIDVGTNRSQRNIQVTPTPQTATDQALDVMIIPAGCAVY